MVQQIYLLFVSAVLSNSICDAFTVTPSIQFPLSKVGIGVACPLPVNYPVPGLTLTFVNAVKPVSCSSLQPTGAVTDDSSFTALDGLTNFIQVDGNTGDIIPNNAEGLAPSPSVGTYFTQTYSGYCVGGGAAAHVSNNFTIKVTWGNCG